MANPRAVLKWAGITSAACTLALCMVPWHGLVEHRLVALLEARGFKNVRLTVAGMGFSSVALSDVSLGDEKLIALKHLTITYSPYDLWRGHLGVVSLTDLRFKTGEITVAGDDVSFTMEKASGTSWKWIWKSNRIAITGLPVDMPVTQASGTVTADAEHVELQGVWGSADKAFSAAYRMNYLFARPDDSSLTVQSLTLPWSGGTVGLHQAVIPLSAKAYTVTLRVKEVSLDALLQPLTGNRAKATGTLSGLFPLAISASGILTPLAGALRAESPGTIVMSPDAIPGDNPQIILLREVMKDFHYTTLSVGVDNDKNGKLSVILALEGNNPAAYGARAVKLNVHLSGDVLDFISQSMAVNSPRKLLKQGTYAH